jgi:hypothetical protein
VGLVPGELSGTAPATVATDYDLFLTTRPPTYVYSSQSFDDSTGVST